MEQSHIRNSRGAVIPSAAGMVVRWQPGRRTEFINVATVATAAQRLGQQCGDSRDRDATVLWQQDSRGNSDAAAWHRACGTVLCGYCGTETRQFSLLHSSCATALA